jgi:uncharacterized membrane protein
VIERGPGLLFFGGLHLIFLLVVAAGVALLVIWAIRYSQRPVYTGVPPAAAASAPQNETPLDILARRFASGEITAEEYERGRDLLGGGGKT